MPDHLVLWGPPGTGKTRRLLRNVTDFLDCWAIGKEGRVLFCSHTKAAAHEAASRWTDEQYASRLDIQTLHSVCFRTLKMSRAQVVDDSKLRDFGEQFGIEMTDDGLGREFLNIISLARSRGVELLPGYEQSWRPGSASHFIAFCDSYTQWKDQFGYIDFNDMLYMGATRLKKHHVKDYGLIAIDEAQDLTPLHWSVVYRMMDLLPDVPVIVAGDDDQALYSFTGADPHGMYDFRHATGAESQVLEQSYRIPQQVWELSQAIVTRIVNREPKVYRPRTGLDGRPATGIYEMWPTMDHLRISADRDTLLLYADRFVRAEVEPIVQDSAYNYTALNGYPAPLDTPAGKALCVAMTHDDVTILEKEELRTAVRGRLSRRGADVWDMVSPYEVLARIRKFDYEMLAVRSYQARDYLRAVDYSKPVNLRLSTIHGAKGLQADDVHLILSLSPAAWQQGAMDPDHLHRLFYVAVTRAKENLYIYDGEGGYEIPLKFR